MKDSNLNDIDWYDFYAGGATRACAIKVSQSGHYKPSPVPRAGWTCCWTTETMWKKINCDDGWPSGFSDGEVCKVWWLDISGLHSRQGVWDPDDNYCIITSESPSGCTSDHTESTTDGVVDTCGGRKAGDGNCEQACGAPPDLDEKDPVTCRVKDLNCPSQVTPGQTFTISFKFSGTGGDHPYEIVSIYRDGTKEACDVYNKAACDWYTYSKTLTAPNQPGTYTYYARCIGGLSYSTGYCGLYDYEKSCTIEVVSTAKPDLVITDVWFGSDKKVHYTIKNQGNADASSSYSYLYIWDEQQSRWIPETHNFVLSLSAGSSSNEYFSSWTCTAGTSYKVKVVADAINIVDESDENNNDKIVTLPCSCSSNDDCSSVSCSGGYAAYCDLSSHTCKCGTSCISTKDDCADKYCCAHEVDPSREDCVGKGTIINYGGKSYLCDPPAWGSDESQNTSEEVQPTIFDVIFNFFQNIFSVFS